MNPNKLKSILDMNGKTRFDYFIRNVSELEEVWGLYDNGWASSVDETGKVLIPFWPEAEFASICAKEEWKAFHPDRMDLGEFLSHWIPKMENDGIDFLIFPKPDDEGVIMQPQRLAQAIQKELELYL